MEYDRLIGEWIAAGRPSSIATSSDITIAELCRRYKAFIEHYYVSGGSDAITAPRQEVPWFEVYDDVC
jgi:hypothetical protein